MLPNKTNFLSYIWNWLIHTKIDPPFKKVKIASLFMFGFILFFPLFLTGTKLLPPSNLPFNIDFVLLAILIILFLYIIIKLLYRFLFVLLGITVFLLGFGSATKGYGFAELTQDYTDFTFVITKSGKPIEIISSKLSYFPNKLQISKTMDFQSVAIRKFCIKAIKSNFKNITYPSRFKPLVHSLAIFKEINHNWYYMYDPVYREYFASPVESIESMTGDCDDHSILMASCVKAVGGTPRLVYTGGHIYPELYLGKKTDADTIVKLITEKLFRAESKGKAIHYHVDESNNLWLNLDYTSRYPGGRFMREEILGIYTIF